MAGPQDVAAQIDDALAAAARCATGDTVQHYEALGQALHDLGELAELSCESHVDYPPLIGKLRAGNALSAEEMTVLRLLILGDADYYLKYDREFDRCKTEVTNILVEIERLKTSEFSIDTLMHVSVLCREANSLLAPTQHYLDSRDRVRRFEESTKGAIDRDSARTLATIVEGMFARSR